MATAKSFIDLSISHLGEPYVLGSIVPMNNSLWKGPWDCAEFVSYIVQAATGELYGNRNNDSYTGYWAEDVTSKKLETISVNEAVQTAGGILLRKPKAGMIGHIAFSDGKGNTYEARGKAYGVCRYLALNSDGSNARGWDTGIRIPGVQYEPTIKLQTDQNNLIPVEINETLLKQVQSSLHALALFFGDINGRNDDKLSQALYNFQLLNDLEPSGLIDADSLANLYSNPKHEHEIV